MKEGLTQSEKDINVMKFYLKFFNGRVGNGKTEIKNKIANALEMLELGESPDDKDIQAVYTEAHNEHTARIQEEEATNDYFMAERLHAQKVKELRELQDKLRLARMNLVKVLGDEKATQIITRTKEINIYPSK